MITAPIADNAASLLTAPTSEPVTLALAKQQCLVFHDLDDDYLTHLISVARELIEKDTSRALMPQTWRLTCDIWPTSRVVMLPRPPLVSITSIAYDDATGSAQTLDDELYSVETSREPGRVVFADNLPALSTAGEAVRITYVAGYADAAAVPAIARHAILLLVGHWFRKREAIGSVPSEVDAAYQSLRKALLWGRYP